MREERSFPQVLGLSLLSNRLGPLPQKLTKGLPSLRLARGWTTSLPSHTEVRGWGNREGDVCPAGLRRRAGARVPLT